ncbi:MAG: choice-of-anchor D domain-containing protein [Deltaproteobacteria bacterium]|nr:choice-of-anchor D domain-containing protein [Deltaproteobacteria bacterium]
MSSNVASAATITVLNLGNAGADSLRAAITTANGNADPSNTINFDPGLTGVIQLGSALPTITKDLTINAPALSITISGDGNRIFNINSPGNNQTVSISGLNLTGANVNATDGGAILVSTGDTLNLSDSALYNNRATTVIIGGSGGAMLNDGGTVNLANVTFNGNTAGNDGGAIRQNGGTMTLNNVTIAGNTASDDGGGISIGGGTVTVGNSILGGNSNTGGNSPDCSGALTSANFNLIQSTLGCTVTLGVNDITGQNPLLGPIQNNGGTTATMALLVGSPALDTGDNGTCEATDQRGVVRPQGTNCDMGAYEFELGGSPTDADLSVSGDVNPTLSTVGGILSYSIDVANAGQGSASNVRLTAIISGEVINVAETPAVFSCSTTVINPTATRVVCELGTIPSGGSVSVGINAETADTGVVSASYTALSLTTTDPDLTNNSGSSDAFVPGGGFGAITTPVANPFDFGPVDVLETSAAQTFTIEEQNGFDMRIFSVTLSDQQNFTIVDDNCTGLILNSSGTSSCDVDVVFNPMTNGPFSGEVIFATDATNTSNGQFTWPIEGDGIINPVVSVNPAGPIDFGQIGVGQSSQAQVVQLTNTGTTDLTMNADAEIDPLSNLDFSVVSTTCLSGTVLGAHEDCVALVVYTPSSLGVATPSGSLVFDTDAGLASVTLDGEGILGPAMSIVPDPMSFPDQLVGATSEARLVEVRSVGTAPLTNISVSSLATGTNFSVLQDNCDGQDLPVGASCMLQVTFTPDDAILFNDSLDVSADNVATETVDFGGTGIQSAISSSGSGAFGSVNVGAQGGPNTITLTNTSTTASLNIGNLQQVGPNPNQFAIANDNCSNAVLAPSPGPGNTCTFQVLFLPTAGGSFTDSVLVPNDSATPNFAVALSGTGAVPGVALAQFSPTVLDYDLTLPETGSATEAQTVTVTNIGTSNLTITSLSLGGTDAAAFSQTNNCDGQTLASGDSCTATVTFSSSVVGDFNAILLVASNSSGTPFLVLLGSARSDATGGGGCSLGATQSRLPGAAFALFSLALAGAATLRRRAR